jgi:hypothetical protein
VRRLPPSIMKSSVKPLLRLRAQVEIDETWRMILKFYY